MNRRNFWKSIAGLFAGSSLPTKTKADEKKIIRVIHPQCVVNFNEPQPVLSQQEIDKITKDFRDGWGRALSYSDGKFFVASPGCKFEHRSN